MPKITGRHSQMQMNLLAIVGVYSINTLDDESEEWGIYQDLLKLLTKQDNSQELEIIEYLLEANPDNIQESEWGVEVVEHIFPKFTQNYLHLTRYLLVNGLDLPEVNKERATKADRRLGANSPNLKKLIDLGDIMNLRLANDKHYGVILQPSDAEKVACRLDNELEARDEDGDLISALAITRMSFGEIGELVANNPNTAVMRQILLELYPDEYYWAD